MICQTSRFNTVVYGRINRARSLVLKGSVTATAVVLNVYGLIQDAANSADNLKMHNSFYYNALYANHLDDDVLSHRTCHHRRSLFKSDDYF